MRKDAPNSTEPILFHRRFGNRLECIPSCISSTNAFSASAVTGTPAASKNDWEFVQPVTVSHTPQTPNARKRAKSSARLRQSCVASLATSPSKPLDISSLARRVACKASHSNDSSRRSLKSATNAPQPSAAPAQISTNACRLVSKVEARISTTQPQSANRNFQFLTRRVQHNAQ